MLKKLANLIKSFLLKKTRKIMREATPLKKIGKPEEIANTVYYLLSDKSSFTTGQTLVSDGGRVPLP